MRIRWEPHFAANVETLSTRSICGVRIVASRIQRNSNSATAVEPTNLECYPRRQPNYHHRPWHRLLESPSCVPK